MDLAEIKKLNGLKKSITSDSQWQCFIPSDAAQHPTSLHIGFLPFLYTESKHPLKLEILFYLHVVVFSQNLLEM